MKKFRNIFRFEFNLQISSITNWLYFIILFGLSFLFVIANAIHDAREGDYFLNSPVVIGVISVFCSLFWLLVTGSIAGNAAARDMETRMYSLTYTSSVRKGAYLGGKFMAAFLFQALMLLSIPAGIMVGIHFTGVEAELLGPFNPFTYLGQYLFILLPNAFIVTAIQFSLAILNRRAILSYLGSILLFVIAYLIGQVVSGPLELRALGILIDPIAFTPVLDYMEEWSPIEKNTRHISAEGFLLWNRILWLFIAFIVLAFTYFRFQFAYYTGKKRWSLKKQKELKSPEISGIPRAETFEVPQIPRSFNFTTRIYQTFALAWNSFRKVTFSRGSLFLFILIPIFVILILPEKMDFLNIPLLPRTDYIITFFLTPLTNPNTPWIITIFLIIFYAGEIVWREREIGISDIADATPMPEWVLFIGKFIGLTLAIITWMTVLMISGIIAQLSMVESNLEVGLYFKLLFGMQLIDYLLFGILALVVHSLVNNKFLGHLVALFAYTFIAFASWIGVEHNLLIYGSDPGWSYTDMKGFGPDLGPWLYFKFYWICWALLLAMVSILLWGRGRERTISSRFKIARKRFTGYSIGFVLIALMLIFSTGGFIFYNTNVLNEYSATAEIAERSAEYERQFRQYRDLPQPQLISTRLDVEIYPDRRALDLNGSYILVNKNSVPIDSIHLSVLTEYKPEGVVFNKATRLVLADEDLGYWIYRLEDPLHPNDTLQLDFEVHYQSNGFKNRGMDDYVIANGTHFYNYNFLPVIGYQIDRELKNNSYRIALNLPSRPQVPSLFDEVALKNTSFAEQISFEAVVGTDEDEIAIAPGELMRTWLKDGRRYFQYSSNAPINNVYPILSAEYEVYEGKWKASGSSEQEVDIQVLHHPGHEGNREKMIEAVQAALSFCSEKFGPYPYKQIRVVEMPGHGRDLNADAINITIEEAFSLINSAGDPRNFDLPFYAIAHEVSHQWWAIQLAPARVEGLGIISESLATYSGIRVVEETYGKDHMHRLLDFMRESMKPELASVPLLRGTSDWNKYRKGPFAIYAVREFIGKEKVDNALHNFFEKYTSENAPLPTSVDFYKELQMVTPDSLQYLLHDLFEANTFWELKIEEVRTEKTKTGHWQVALEIQTKKVLVDEMGVEKKIPMNDWVEIGVYAVGAEDRSTAKTLYLKKHRIGTGKQILTINVPEKPGSAGIDPDHLLIDLELDNNFRKVKMEGAEKGNEEPNLI